MTQLYVVMIGGQLPGHRLEVHDIEVYLAEDDEALVTACRKATRTFKAKHLDGWIRIPLVNEGASAGAEGSERLYLVELGRNEAGRFFELHDYRLIAAASVQAAVRQSKALHPGWHVDTVVDLSRMANDESVTVDPTSAVASAQQVSRYIRL